MTIFVYRMNINPNYEIQVMKIIHTSDWHLGQIFNDYDRTEEHAAFLRRLTDIVKEERSEALLVSGDIFHNSTPSSAVQRFYTDAVLELKNACSGMTVVITAGNHDSHSRLEIDRNLWNCMGVKVVGSVSKHDGEADLEKHIIEIPSGDGGVAGFVIALPHVYRQNYPASKPESSDNHSRPNTDGGSGDQELSRQKAFYRALMETVSRRNPDELPVVMMAHLAVSGCDISGHDEPIGGMEYTSLDTFPQGYDYLALGHIHHPQTLNRRSGVIKDTDGPEVYSSPVARYCGSPVPVSFDEDYRHSISVVEIGTAGQGGEGQKTVTVRQIEIPQTVPMITLPESPVPFEEALCDLENFPPDRKAYIRLNVLIKDYLPQNASARAIAAAETKECRYCCMKVTREAEVTDDPDTRFSVEEIRATNPVDIACMYYRQRFGTELEPELMTLLEDVASVESKLPED